MMDTYAFRAGTAPLLVSMPHVGTRLPAELAARMTDAAAALPDTDWHLERLYDFLAALGASVLVATHSRYVVDLNRPPDGANLYPGQDTTGLVPVDTFARAPLYRDGAAPTADEVPVRVERYWRPYHQQLARELDRLRVVHGYALLWDAHSIASEVPRFFVGRLPDFNLGTADGASCAREIENAVAAVARQAPGYTAVLNGRFKGGYITRRYGRPTERVHAIQLELAEITYMHEAPPFAFDEVRAARLRPHLRAMIEAMLEAGRQL
jgi:N-formylglutamate deformylase